MAEIPRKNPRYRTKHQISEDVAYVLHSPLTYGTKFAVLHDVTWVWTEFTGKYVGCRYWSKLACADRFRNKKAKVRHEHIVPKRVVIKTLMELKEPTPESVFDICDRFLIAVVLTPLEDSILSVYFHKGMPPSFYDSTSGDFHDPWLRYKQHPEIQIVDLKGKDPPPGEVQTQTRTDHNPSDAE